MKCPECGERLVRASREGAAHGMILKASYVLLGTERRTIDIGCPKCHAELKVLPGRILRFIPRRKSA